MGFFIATLTENIQIHPSYFGPNLRREVIRQLLVRVEGTIKGELGYIIAVVLVEEPFPDGILDNPMRGFASFDITYQAVILRPIRNEIVNAIVTRPVQLGFYASVGPMKLFVVYHNMPSMQFNVAENTWEPIGNTDEEDVIKKNAVVRLRLMTISTGLQEMVVVGDMKASYMGVVDFD